MKIIVVSGYYNPLHGGHLSNMKEAKKLGDELWVIVNNDKQQMSKKGKIIMSEQERLEIVEELRCVNQVILSIDEDESVVRTLRFIKEIKPGYEIVYAKGGDRNVDNIPETPFCKELGIEVVSNVGKPKINSSSRIMELQ